MENLRKKIDPSPKVLRIFYFITGIVATIAYRIIFLLDSYWTVIAWYTGTIGFMIYFWHRSYVQKKKANLVKDYHLLEVIEKSSAQEEKKKALKYILETSVTSKARINSLFIFIASAVAFVVALITDIYKII